MKPNSKFNLTTNITCSEPCPEHVAAACGGAHCQIVHGYAECDCMPGYEYKEGQCIDLDECDKGACVFYFRPLNVLFSILVPLKGSTMVPFDN